MSNWRGTWRSACLAMPLLAAAGTVMAAQPEGGPPGRYVYVPPGAVVLVVPAPHAIAAIPAVAPAAMVARQDSMIRRMVAEMDAMMAMPFPDPQQMIRSVMDGMPQGMPGSGFVMTSVSTDSGSCRETIIYGSPGANARPQVKVTRQGDACGAIDATGPLGVTEALPVPAAPPPMAPRRDRLWTIGYPPHPAGVTVPPRT